MALDAGVLTLTVEFAQGLKDKDWFGKMDPYAIITIGSQTYRTKTVNGGGTNPVFNEAFKFNIINENDFHIVLKDEDVTKDELIGSGRGDLAKVRSNKTDRIQVPMGSKSGKQHGFVSVSLSFAPNNAPAHNGQQPPQQHAPPPQYGAPAPYAYPPPGAHGYAPAYAPPPHAYAPPPHGHPPYPYPQAGAPQYPPPQYPPPQYPPGQYAPQPHYPPQPYR